MTDTGTTPPRVVALWSTPRSLSTAFFRMMIERDDFHVLHEPFSYLAEFGRVEIGGVRLDDEAQLIAHIRELSRECPVFFKDTTDERYPGLLADTDFLARDAVHTFLMRDPQETIASYLRVNPGARADQIGFGHQEELFDAVARLTGRDPFLMDAAALAADPAATVAAYCARVGIPYRPEALSWAAGDRPEWGPSQRWHRDVSATTGFVHRPPDAAALRDLFARPGPASLLAAQQPYHRRLRERRTAVAS